MPDAGSFENGMPDRDENPVRGDVAGWSNAFAALPQESPDAGGWQRVQARLPTPATRARWPWWLATAASLVVAVAVPWRMSPQPSPDASAAARPAQAATPAPAIAIAKAAETPPAQDGATQPRAPTVARGDIPRRIAREARARPAARSIAPPAEAPGLADNEAPAAVDFAPLYARSAQLESLLALARDDRVTSGARAALGDELDGQVAAIDATLAEPGLTDAQRAGLWGERVNALQQLVGIETTNRLYAARGQSYDAALVSID